VREDLCLEAIRLTRRLGEHPATNAPNVHALLALFCLQAARLPTRLDRDGNLLLLADQDRTLWNSGWVRRGLEQLELSASGVELSGYHLQAGIAAIHVTSSSFENTDWPALLHLYDLLLALVPSPVVALNRAVALSMVDGPEAGLRLVESLAVEASMQSYRFLPAVRADMLRRLGRLPEAAQAYRQALQHSYTEPERRFLLGRLDAIEGSSDLALEESLASTGVSAAPAEP